MSKTTSLKFGLRIAVITVSDSRHAGQNEDVSGSTLIELIKNAFKITQAPVQMELHQIGDSTALRSSFGGGGADYEASDYIWKMVISDDYESIRSAIKCFCDGAYCWADVVITSGGTGFAERDVTPEATTSVLTKPATGLVTAIINRSLRATPFAALSRLAAGVRGRSLVVNFPGSVKAVKECWEVLEPLIPHAVDLLRGNSGAAESTHENLAREPDGVEKPHPHHRHSCHHHHHSQTHSADDPASLTSVPSIGTVSGRPRHSPYPMIDFALAIEQVLEQASRLPRRVIQVDVMDALNRVLAEDVRAPDPQPSFPASIKDGYAVITSDGAGERNVAKLAATAGAEGLPKLQSGWCVRISTGAPVPDGADAVVQVEDTELVEEKNGEELKIKIVVSPSAGQDIRPIGCDVAQNELVLEKGLQLTSSEIGILASVGKARVAVYGWPKVAVLSTGDELIDAASNATGTTHIPYGKIRDTNRPELIALLRQHGVDPKSIIDGGICPDETSAILNKLRDLFDQADIVVTSGGVSMGERDLIKQILVDDLGFTLHFARVKMKPGKPTTFASNIWNTVSGAKPVLFFGLPGNPVSAWVTAILYLLPAARLIAGYESPKATTIRVRLASDYYLDPRPEFARAVFAGSAVAGFGDDGVPLAMIAESNQMSSRLVSNRRANLLLVLPAKSQDQSMVRAGEIVQAIIIGDL